MVTKRCAWGICKSDSRYKHRDHMKGVWFVPFPKPKSQLEKCLRWVKACGRPYDQLNVDKIKEHHFVCSKHFVGDNGPSAEHPDPLQAEPTDAKKARYPQKRRSDSPPTTENGTTNPPKMSRECAAEVLLALKVGGSVSVGQVPGIAKQKCENKFVTSDEKSFDGTFEVCLPQFVTDRDKNLMMASHRKTMFDVNAV